MNCFNVDHKIRFNLELGNTPRTLVECKSCLPHLFVTKQCPLCVFKGIVYSCNLCDHKSTRQDHSKRHQQSKHEGFRNSCDQCEYQATLQGNLKTHQQSKHKDVIYSCH